MDEHILPEAFEEFNETRKAGFMRAKAVKDAGGRIAGTFCTFTPDEVFDAAGWKSVSLCATSDETIPFAERDLPNNLCPLVKSSYGFAVSDRCPYTYFSDLIVGETTCDAKKKMYELLGQFKKVHVMQLPQNQDRSWALDQWKAEVQLLIDVLRRDFGATITEESLRDAARQRNRLRQAKLALMELMKLDPAPALGGQIDALLRGTDFSFDVSSSTEMLEAKATEIRSAWEAGARPVDAGAKRILITGCPIGGVWQKTVKLLEENGAVVVCMENCSGIKPNRLMVDADAPDIVEAIAKRYLEIGCAVMSPNDRRLALIRQLVAEYRVDGIVDVVLHSCHPYSVERTRIRRLAEDLGIKYLSTETDYSQADVGQMSTRLSAFVELL